MARKLNLVGISMIRNDADIVEAFVRHCFRVLDQLFVIVHSPEDGTGEILKELPAEGLPMTLVLDDEPAFLQGERLTRLARQVHAALAIGETPQGMGLVEGIVRRGHEGAQAYAHAGYARRHGFERGRDRSAIQRQQKLIGIEREDEIGIWCAARRPACAKTR